MQKTLALLAVSALTLSACTTGPDLNSEQATSEESNVSTEETIKLGYIGPLTGGAASYGEDEQRIIDMWLENNPTIADKNIEIIYEDGQCDSTEASKAAQKLINIDKVNFILGGVCSDETEAILPVAETTNTLVFSSTSTSPKLSGASPVFLRNTANDSDTTSVMAEYISENFSNVAIIAQNSSFAEGYSTEIIPKLQDSGVEIVVEEYFNEGTTDFKTVLQKVKDSEATALLNIAGGPTEAALINKQAFELGLDIQIFGTDHFVGDEFKEIAQNSAEGSIIVQLSNDETIPETKEFLEMYREAYDREPVLGAYAPAAWDRMNILKMAIEEAGEDPVAVRDYIIDMGQYMGAAGATDFFETGDSSQKPKLQQYVDGKLELLK